MLKKKNIVEVLKNFTEATKKSKFFFIFNVSTLLAKAERENLLVSVLAFEGFWTSPAFQIHKTIAANPLRDWTNRLRLRDMVEPHGTNSVR